MKLLIVEDEDALRESIISYFTEDGNICEYCTDFKSACDKLAVYEYDCILLDLGLPDNSGLELLKYVKKKGKKESVIIISARNSLDDKISGLNLGADDYLAKPFHLAELKARIIAIHRRKSFNGNNVIEYGDIHIDIGTMTVVVNKEPITLTKKEYDILLYFIANAGKVISKTALADHLWKDEIDLSDSYDFIYTHIKNLRKKLQMHSGTDYIKSVYGIGYRFSE